MNRKRYHRFTKEEVLKIKKRNKSTIEKVNLWQNFKYVKSLTCKKEECDGVLEPKESKLKVILKCPKCGFIQSYVPRTILKTKLDIPEVLIRNQHRGNDIN